MVSSSLISASQTVTSGWQWHNWEGLPYLTCSLLSDWKHGFFTQHFSPRTPELLVEVLHPDAQAYRVKQVHGNRVLKPSEMEIEDNDLSPADGIITEQPQQAVWVASADCTPVLIANVKTGQVAAVHAGWRGTAQRIVPEAIARLVTSGSSLEHLRIALGPAISGEVYQVNTDVAVQVCASFVKKSETSDLESILAEMETMPDSPLSPDAELGKVRLDVRRVNQLQLEHLGIAPEQIAIAPHCTYQQPEHFFSYRRSHEKKVQWSGIVSE